MNVISSFSHELRTPLNGAIQPLELALKDPLIPTNQKKTNIKNALTSLFILENTLNDIIDLTLLTTNQFSINISKLNLNQFIKEIKKIVSIQIEFKKLLFAIDIDDSIPEHINTDYKRLKQVTLNLLTNAIKFTNQGSISLRMKYFQQELEISIEDTGIGMNEKRFVEVTAILANPEQFFSSTSAKNCYQTSQKPNLLKYIIDFSLGLPISQNIAIHLNKNLNGIQMQSQYKFGSKFTFSISNYQNTHSVNQSFNSIEEGTINSVNFSRIQLPQFQANFLTQTQQINQDSSQIPQEQYFLIVDDDCFNLLALEMHLKYFKKQCIKAFNGVEALEILESIYNSPIKEKEIQLIFMDYQMPELNGVETTKQIQQLISQNILPEIPIVACTAFGAREQISQCLEAGMIDYIIKPVTHAQLATFLRKQRFIK